MPFARAEIIRAQKSVRAVPVDGELIAWRKPSRGHRENATPLLFGPLRISHGPVCGILCAQFR